MVDCMECYHYQHRNVCLLGHNIWLVVIHKKCPDELDKRNETAIKQYEERKKK